MVVGLGTGHHAWRLVCVALLAAPAGVLAQSVSIDNGASWRVGDGAIDLDCAALDVAGSFHAQDGKVDGIGVLDIGGELTATSAALEVGGDWINRGTFVAGNGSVHLTDRCGASVALVDGSSAFSTLAIDSASGKAYAFAAGATQSVALSLRLAGAPGLPLPIRSTQAGVQAALALAHGASQQISWLDVADLAAPDGSAWLAPGPAPAFNSIDSGNNYRWFEPTEPPPPPTPVPTTSTWALLALALTLLGSAKRYFSRR